MPTYAYLCPKCKTEFDVIKAVQYMEFVEQCSECGEPSNRVVRFKGAISADAGPAYFHYGLGKVVRSKQDIRNELAKIRGETGRDLIEVGNEAIKKSKPKKAQYDMNVMTQDYKKALNGRRKH